MKTELEQDEYIDWILETKAGDIRKELKEIKDNNTP